MNSSINIINYIGEIKMNRLKSIFIIAILSTLFYVFTGNKDVEEKVIEDIIEKEIYTES